MKKTFILALLVAAAGTGHAQGIKAGTVSLGGSVGYNRSVSTQSAAYNAINTPYPSTYNYSNKYTNSQFTLAPAVGYFVADNFAIGAELTYFSQKQTSSSSTNGGVGAVVPELDPNTSLRLGVYAQYYKMLGEQFGLIGTLGGGYQSSKSYNFSTSNGIVETTGNGYYAAITPGIVFFPIPKLGLSATMGALAFSHYSYDYPRSSGTVAPTNYESKNDTFGANFGLSQLQFGGTYYFGR
ncbi:MAG: hypothetical protein JWP58_2902 [Hymenobacter sp.]|nr:hypothetical protein [Hymenobacter sp.]